MKSFKYSDHSISRCMYMYPLLDLNAELDYVKSNSAFSKLALDISRSDQNRRIIIPEDSKHEADSSSLTGYFEMDFSLDLSWNVLAVTDSDGIPMSIIYDDYILNTREVENIHLKYTLNYKSGSIVVSLDIGKEYVKHMNEYIGTKMQPIPKMMSRTSEVSEVNWSDENFNLSYDNSSILNDNKSTYDYLLKIDVNPNITYDYNSKYYMTGTTQDLFIIKVNNDGSAKLYPLNYQYENPEINLGILPTIDICHIELVENGYGLILVSNSNDVFYSKATNRRPSWSYSSWYRLGDSNIYDILIPTFIDLCGSYVKLPRVRTKTPTAYEVKKWTGLFTESDTYGDRIYQLSYDYPNSTPSGDLDLKISYWESLGIQNQNTFFMSTTSNQNSPVSMHQFDTINPNEGNSVILDFNIKMMTSLYVDLFNNGRINKLIIPRDCGLEIVNSSGGNEFITYLGEHYRLPQGAKVMNMCYYNGSIVTSLIDGRSQNVGSNILCGKYGIILTENMIN